MQKFITYLKKINRTRKWYAFLENSTIFLSIITSFAGIMTMLEMGSFSILPHLVLLVGSAVYIGVKASAQLSKYRTMLNYPLLEEIKELSKINLMSKTTWVDTLQISESLTQVIQKWYSQKKFECNGIQFQDKYYFFRRIFLKNKEDTLSFVNVFIEIDQHQKVTIYSTLSDEAMNKLDVKNFIVDELFKSLYSDTIDTELALTEKVYQSLRDTTISHLKENLKDSISKNELITQAQLAVCNEKAISEKQLNEDSQLKIENEFCDVKVLQQDAEHALKFLDLKYFEGKLNLANHRDNSQL